MRSVILLAFLLAACGSATTGSAPAAPAAAVTAPPAVTAAPDAAAPADAAPVASSEQAALFPTPYTAEQIRDATAPGRTYTWRVEVTGKPAFEKTLAFTQVDAEGASLSSDTETKHVTWEELRQHAEFPRAAVTTRDEAITVPAGHYACIVYVVAKPADSEVSTFYFAKDMPGAPVLFYTEKGGQRVVTSTLIRYAAGS